MTRSTRTGSSRSPGSAGRSSPAKARPELASLVVSGPSLIRVPCVSECDSVPDDGRATEQARALHGVFAEPIADRVDSRLEAVALARRGPAEQVQLTAV